MINSIKKIKLVIIVILLLSACSIKGISNTTDTSIKSDMKASSIKYFTIDNPFTTKRCIVDKKGKILYKNDNRDYLGVIENDNKYYFYVINECNEGNNGAIYYVVTIYDEKNNIIYDNEEISDIRSFYYFDNEKKLKLMSDSDLYMDEYYEDGDYYVEEDEKDEEILKKEFVEEYDGSEVNIDANLDMKNNTLLKSSKYEKAYDCEVTENEYPLYYEYLDEKGKRIAITIKTDGSEDEYYYDFFKDSVVIRSNKYVDGYFAKKGEGISLLSADKEKKYQDYFHHMVYGTYTKNVMTGRHRKETLKLLKSEDIPALAIIVGKYAYTYKDKGTGEMKLISPSGNDYYEGLKLTENYLIYNSYYSYLLNDEYKVIDEGPLYKFDNIKLVEGNVNSYFYFRGIKKDLFDNDVNDYKFVLTSHNGDVLVDDFKNVNRNNVEYLEIYSSSYSAVPNEVLSVGTFFYNLLDEEHYIECYRNKFSLLSFDDIDSYEIIGYDYIGTYDNKTDLFLIKNNGELSIIDKDGNTLVKLNENDL